MSKDIIPVDNTIHTLPDNDDVFTEEEYELFNNNPRYTHLVHKLGGIKPEPRVHQNNVTEEVDGLPTNNPFSSSFLKAVLLLVVIGVIFSCVISTWNTLPPSFEILPGLWFNK